MIGHLRPHVASSGCLDRRQFQSARNGQQGTRTVAQDEVKVNDMHAGGQQAWESTAEAVGEGACPCLRAY